MYVMKKYKNIIPNIDIMYIIPKVKSKKRYIRQTLT